MVISERQKEPFYKNLTIIIFSGFLFFTLDYFIKNAVVTRLAGRVLDYGVIKFQLFANNQMAFSIPINQTVVIFLASLTLLVFLQYFTICCRDGLYANMWAANLVIWGAFGNLYDRLMRGYVVDYVAIGPMPVFNLSDAAIIIGLVSLMLLVKNHEKPVVLQLGKT